MKQDNPFAKLGALDQQLYQETAQKPQGMKTSENEITRIAINYFIEEYRQNGEQSILVKILKLLNA